MKDEKGFAMPLVLIAVFVMSIIVLQQIVLYRSELVYYREHEKLFELHQVVQMGIADVKQTLIKANPPKTGYFVYESGDVTYQIIDNSDAIWTVRLTSRTNNGSDRMSYLYFDIEQGKLTRWVEGS